MKEFSGKIKFIVVTISSLRINKFVVKFIILPLLISFSFSAYSIKDSSILPTTTFMFCGVNQGYQGNLVAIYDPQKSMQIVKEKLIQRNDGIKYEIYPGKVTYRKDYGCPDGGEVIAVVISDEDPVKIRETGKYLQDALFQTSLSIATYNSSNRVKGAKLTKGFMATLNGFPMDIIAAEWQRQAEKI